MSKGVSLQDFLKDIKTNHAETYEKAKEGGPSFGPLLPINLEYRVTVDSAEYKASNAGNMQLVVVYEISEPSEYAGVKVQDYYQPQPGNELAQKKMSSVLGALGPDLSGLGNDWAELSGRLVGLSGIITVRHWGEQNDRNGVRWVNADRGQVLRDNIPPQKASGTKNPLRPDVNVPKNDAAVQQQVADEQVAPEPEQQTQPAVLPQAARPAGGPNLPPGLR